MRFVPLGDSAVTVVWDQATGQTALTQASLLAADLEAAPIPGVEDVVSAYATVTVFYDPERFAGEGRSPYEAVRDRLAARAATSEDAAERVRAAAPSYRLIEIPVCYGGDFGPDLAAVAEHNRLDTPEVVARHSEAHYRVQAIGFAPGFPYLAGLPESLCTPRHSTPRLSVPAGSVGIGGDQTGVYPLATPGGWQIIGRTPLVLFRPSAANPALLRAGDRVRFRAIDEEEFRRLSAAETTASDEAPAPAAHPSAPAGAIEVLRGGMLTTVQDLGRRRRRGAGVPLAGAMDPFALRVANLLVGNPEDAAGLEITLVGPELKFDRDAIVAAGGAEFEGIAPWRPRLVRAGEILRFVSCRRGCRAYLAVAGGIATELVLGSRSTCLRGGFGGWQGRKLQDGDRLPIGPLAGPAAAPDHFALSVSPSLLPAYSAAPTVRVLPGAQRGEFDRAAFTAEFRISPQSDRMGLRLAGPALKRSGQEDLTSSAAAPGTIQVPPDGQPIVLMADAQTLGGYPQLAHVIGADLPLLAQLRPGDSVRFEEVTLAEAHRLALERAHGLALLRAGLASR